MSPPAPNRRFSERSIRLAILLILLYLILPVQALLPINDPDVWWRFRVGEWIVQNHAVPFVDYYSAYDAGKPWIEYSWLFALLMYGLHAQFGLVAIAYFIVAMALAISAAVHQLIRGSGLSIFAEVAFVGAALASMKSLMTPRPWLITIFFFGIELLIIDRVRRGGRSRELWILPPLFAIWANFHIQFVYGLAVIFLLVLEAPLATVFNRLGWHIDVPPSPHRVGLIAAACVAATFLTPYHVLLYRQIFDYMGGQTGIFQNTASCIRCFFAHPVIGWFYSLLFQRPLRWVGDKNRRRIRRCCSSWARFWPSARAATFGRSLLSQRASSVKRCEYFDRQSMRA